MGGRRISVAVPWSCCIFYLHLYDVGTTFVAKAADENGGKKKIVAMMWRKWREVTRRPPFTESEGTIADHRILSSHVTITITMSHCHLSPVAVRVATTTYDGGYARCVSF